jgi:MFS family permease
MLELVIWVDVAIVVVGAVAAVAVSDVLGHRGLPTWPVGLIALAVFIVAGLTYSAWLAAAALGIGCGALIVSARVFVQTVFERRRRQSDSRRIQEEKHAHRRTR